MQPLEYYNQVCGFVQHLQFEYFWKPPSPRRKHAKQMYILDTEKKVERIITILREHSTRINNFSHNTVSYFKRPDLESS